MTVSSSASVAQGNDSGKGGGDSVASNRGTTVAMDEALFLLSTTSLIAGDLVSPSSSQDGDGSRGKAGYAPGESKDDGLGITNGSS